MRPLQVRPGPAVLVLAGALLLGTSGGAVAGSMITGRQIKNGTVTGADVKDRSLRKADLARAAVAQLKGDKGAPGMVRGYAHINGSAVTKQSGGVTVTNDAPGEHCVTVPGVSSATSVAVATIDYSTASTSTGTNADDAEVETSKNLCAAPAFGVRTFVRTYPNASTTVLDSSNEGFTILVP